MESRLSNLFRISVVSGIQVLLYVSIYQISFDLYSVAFGSVRPDLAYGISLHYGLYVYGLLATINAGLTYVFAYTISRLFCVAACSFVWIFLWVEGAFSMPYRFLLVVAAGMVGFLVVLFLKSRTCLTRELT